MDKEIANPKTNSTETSTQPFLSNEKLLENLIKLGLTVANPTYALEYLECVSYYRLCRFFHLFKDPETSIFDNGTKFEDFVDVYEVDEILQNLVFAAIKPIENFFKAKLTSFFRTLSGKEKNAFIHEKNIYEDLSQHFSIQSNFYKNSIRMIKKSEADRLVLEFISKYPNSNRFDAWTSIDHLSLGSLSYLISCFNEESKLKLLDFLNLDYVHNEYDVLTSSLHSINVIRNICAHNGPLIGTTLSVKFTNILDPHWNNVNKYTISSVLYLINQILKEIPVKKAFRPIWTKNIINLMNSDIKLDIKATTNFDANHILIK